MSLMSNNKNVDDDDNRYDDGDDDDSVRSDLCPYGETQTMSHIVESCPDKTEWLLISATLCG